LSAWFATPPGRHLLAWEAEQFQSVVSDVFGYHALQLGLPQLQALSGNRMPHRWLALPETHALPEVPNVALVSHAAALPFAANSLDLLVMPHTLELSADPHAVLREVERVLRPEGRVVLSGLNPASLWGLRQYRAHALARLGLGRSPWARLYLPEAGAFIGHRRLRDWLRLLSFEIEDSRFGGYRPAVRSQAWLDRFQWLDSLGSRWWPVFGAVYFVVAVKRVRGMHLLGPAWKPRRAQAVPVVVAGQSSVSSCEGQLSRADHPDCSFPHLL